MEVFTAADIRKIYQLSQKQLHDFDRSGIVQPSIRVAQGKGSHRLYSFEDLLAFRFIKQLLKAGWTIRNIKKIIHNLRIILPEKDPLKDCVLLNIDGTILARTTTSNGQSILIDAASHGQLVMPVILSGIQEKVRKDIERLKLEVHSTYVREGTN